MSAPAASAAPAFFAGEFSHSLDDKNRLAVPAGWRGAEGTEFFVVPAPNQHECLQTFPPAEFRAVSERVTANAALSPQARKGFLRQFNSKARLLTTDKQGRLLLPAEMLAHAGIEGSVVLVGNDRRFEIWSPARWAQKTAEEAAAYQHVAEAMGL